MYTALVQDIKALLAGESILKQSKKLDELQKRFIQLKNDDQSEEDDVNKLLAKDLLDEVKRKIDAEKEALKKAEEALISEKEGLINQLAELIANEENIGKAFQVMKDIREAWNKASEKGEFKLKNLDQKFTKLVEEFYYNINIFKAIQEHDLKRNQQFKEVLLEKLETCSNQKASRALMVEIKNLRSEWESIGPVKKELQSEFWDKYRGFLDILYNNFNQYKESEKEGQLENLKKKLDIINYIQTINVENLKSVKDWKVKTQKVLDRQASWKSLGHVPKEHKDKTWVDYRNACDRFFNAKTEFYDAQKEIFKTNKKAKLALCKEAEHWKDAEDIKEATDRFVKIQKEWKNIGPVHQRDEQFLWHKFQNSCNAFFKRKKEAGAKIDAEKDTVNQEKSDIIEQLKTNNQTIDSLKTVYLDWLKTNRAHTKNSNSLFEEFKKLMDNQLSSHQTNYDVFTSGLFKDKIELYASFGDNGAMLDRESRFLREKIEKLQKEINQYENNLGFFGNSKGASSLLKEVEDKIKSSKQLIFELKEKIKMINQY